MNDESELRRQLRAEWEGLAEELIRLHVEGEDELREFLLDGWMLGAVGDVSGARKKKSSVRLADTFSGCDWIISFIN